jgi:hypothetical protein
MRLGMSWDRNGSAAQVRDHEMQPFAFEFVRVGVCNLRMTAIAGLHFQTLFGERPLTSVDRSLAQKIASDAFGSRLCENAAKTITRRHYGLQWLLIGQGDQQGVHGGDMREYGRL